MLDPDKLLLSPAVHQALVEENGRIRAEIRDKGPGFDFSSIKGRLKRAKEMAEAEEAAKAEGPKAS
jgi:signal transduction histidine kinase